MADNGTGPAQGTPATKIAIAGPGRSGTSVLVRLFAEWGFAVPPLRDGNWSEEAQAGLESRIGQDSGFEVDKDPWAYEYLDRIPASQIAEYQTLLVPIRDREDTAISRSVQERAFRASHLQSDHWQWDSWGTVPGGAVSRTDIEGISGALASGLWDLLVKATAAGLTPVLLNFPRFVDDFDYLWDQVGPLVKQRQTRDSAQAAWQRVADPSKVRIRESRKSEVTDLRIRELQAVIEMLRKENRQALAERDEARRQREAIASSRTWRATGWYQSLRRR